jgi:hypothetical protein
MPIITAELNCDSTTAHHWAQAMEQRLSYYCQMSYIETIGELSSFVAAFLADYAETEEQ